MHVVPDFGCDKEFIPFYYARPERFLEDFTDKVFVAINRSAVKETITKANSAGHSG
jgi:hypothetical protein